MNWARLSPCKWESSPTLSDCTSTEAEQLAPHRPWPSQKPFRPPLPPRPTAAALLGNPTPSRTRHQGRLDGTALFFQFGHGGLIKRELNRDNHPNPQERHSFDFDTSVEAGRNDCIAVRMEIDINGGPNQSTTHETRSCACVTNLTSLRQTNRVQRGRTDVIGGWECIPKYLTSQTLNR